MVDLSEMVGKVQMEAVVSDVGNRIVAMRTFTYQPLTSSELTL